MKKNMFKRVGCMALALALTVGGLTACGGDAYENAELAKQHVYRFQELEMPELGGDDSYMMSSRYADGRVYMLFQVYHWDSETNQREYKLVSMNEDGSDVQMAELEVNPVELSPEELGGADGSDGINVDVWLDDIIPDEEGWEEEAAEPEENAGEDIDEEAEDETDVDADFGVDTDFGVDSGFFVDSGFYVDSYMPNEIWEYTSIGSTFIAESGIYGTKYYSYNNYSTGFYTSRNYVCCWNLDGSIRWETEMEDLETEEEYIYLVTMAASPDGSLNLFLSGNTAYKQTVSADGVMGERKAMPDDMKDLFWNYNYILPRNDGKLLLIYSSESNWQEQYMADYDPATDTISDSVQIPGTVLYNSYGSMAAGNTSDIIYPTSTGVNVYNRGDEEGREIMNYINSDVNLSSLQRVIELDETRFIGTFYEFNNYDDLKIGMFTYVPPEEIQDKKVLVLGCNYAGSDIKQRVVEFNRRSQEYKIVIRNYDVYNSYEDWEAGITKLNNDIITGNMPDILVANRQLPVENYIAKGLLTDIRKLIEDDEELSRVEFLENVFDAYSVKGKLYYVIPSFYVRTMLGKTSLVGDRTSWTMNDMMQLMDSMPEGTNLTYDLTRSYFFTLVMQYCGSDFVDVNTGKCNFNSPDFIAMMEFAKKLPEEIMHDDDYWMNFDWSSLYREDKAILEEAYISRVADMNYTINGEFGEPVSYVGFPMESGQGSILYSDNLYCISSKSSNKDGAWEFLRYYLTDEYQKELTYGLPVQKEAFEEKAREALEKPYYIDGDGNKQEYDQTYYMNGEYITLDPMSTEQMDQIVNLIYSVDRVYYYNTDVTNIIEEEMEYFFNDQKSAQDVADTIQRRVQVYVDENS